jgi:hypothetical protein
MQTIETLPSPTRGPRPAAGPETAPETARDLGDPHQASDRSPRSGPSAVQPSDRQQASGL